MMDIREFLFMLRELGIIDRRNLTMQAAVRIVIAAMANLGTIEKRVDDGDGHATTDNADGPGGQDTGRTDSSLVHQGDLLSFANFVVALGRCYEAKTYDGIVPLGKRLASCFVGDLFQKVRSRTDIAALWL